VEQLSSAFLTRLLKFLNVAPHVPHPPLCPTLRYPSLLLSPYVSTNHIPKVDVSTGWAVIWLDSYSQRPEAAR